jgi:hypothetical protein
MGYGRFKLKNRRSPSARASGCERRLNQTPIQSPQSGEQWILPQRTLPYFSVCYNINHCASADATAFFICRCAPSPKAAVWHAQLMRSALLNDLSLRINFSRNIFKKPIILRSEIYKKIYSVLETFIFRKPLFIRTKPFF